MEQTFDLVTYFYPDQWLIVDIGQHEIEHILDCNRARADEIIKEIRKEYGRNRVAPIRLTDFCEYLDIDDILIQLFLVSLNTERDPPPPLQFIAADRTDKPLRLIDDVRDDLDKGLIIYMPPSLYEELNPRGEPMYKRDGFYRCIVRAYEVAQIYECHIDTARAMLRKVREKEDLPERAHVAISKFCKVHYANEDEFRRSLASIHEDDRENED
jgi:hypothetical protein